MANAITIVCPHCNASIDDRDISGKFTMGIDEKTVTVDLQIHGDKCNELAFFTYVPVNDMVNMKEVRNG